MEEYKRFKFNVYFTYISHALMAFSGGWGVIQILYYSDISVSNLTLVLAVVYFVVGVLISLFYGFDSD